MWWRRSPGRCPICGAPACSCTTFDALTVPQTPMRDALLRAAPAPPEPAITVTVSEPISTKDYRRPPGRRRR